MTAAQHERDVRRLAVMPRRAERQDDPSPAAAADVLEPGPFHDAHPDTGVRICRACGCDELNACVEPFSGDPCAWWDDDICTACAGIVQRFFSPEELTFLLHAAGAGELNLTRPDATALTAEGVLTLRATLSCLAPKKEADDD